MVSVTSLQLNWTSLTSNKKRWDRSLKLVLNLYILPKISRKSLHFLPLFIADTIFLSSLLLFRWEKFKFLSLNPEFRIGNQRAITHKYQNISLITVQLPHLEAWFTQNWKPWNYCTMWINWCYLTTTEKTKNV